MLKVFTADFFGTGSLEFTMFSYRLFLVLDTDDSVAEFVTRGKLIKSVCTVTGWVNDIGLNEGCRNTCQKLFRGNFNRNCYSFDDLTYNLFSGGEYMYPMYTWVSFYLDGLMFVGSYGTLHYDCDDKGNPCEGANGFLLVCLGDNGEPLGVFCQIMEEIGL